MSVALLALVITGVATVIATALHRQRPCATRDWLTMRTCTAHGRHEYRRDDPRHVWTTDERLYEYRPAPKMWEYYPGERFERLKAMWRIVAWDHGHHDGSGWRRRGLVVRAWLVLLTGRVRYSYPHGCDRAWELGSWNERTFGGNEQTYYEWDAASVCTGRAWHVHLYTEGSP